MLVYERYLTLYASFAGEAGAGHPVEVSLEQLAEALYCSSRNVKLILRKLIDDGFIDWHAGRGRGNRSRITFLFDKATKLLEIAKELARKGEYKRAFGLIEVYGAGTEAREMFVAWLNGHFGYRRLQTNDAEASDILCLPVTFYNPNIKGVGLNSLGWIDFKNIWLGEAEPLAGNAG